MEDVEDNIINKINESILNNDFDEDGKIYVDLKKYINHISEKDLNTLLNMCYYNVEEIKDGICVIKKDNRDKTMAKKVLIKSVNKLIEEEGFDEVGELFLYTNISGLTPVDVIKIVNSMGYDCYMDSVYGEYIVCDLNKKVAKKDFMKKFEEEFLEEYF